jgi:hypothetical protein
MLRMATQSGRGIATVRPRLAALTSFVMVGTLALVTPGSTEEGGIGTSGGSQLHMSDETYEQWLPGIVDSQMVGGEAAVHGRVLLPGGEPASHATLYLAAWPSVETLAPMREGDGLELKPIAKTRAAADGTYALRIDPKLSLDDLWSGSGTMDVDIVARLGDDYVTYAFSITSHESDPDDLGVAVVNRGTRTTVQPILVDLELGHPDRARLANPLQHDELQHQHTGAPKGTPANDVTADGYQPMHHGLCPGGAGLKEHLGNRPVRVGAIHISASGKQMRFTYGGSAESSLGVGVSSSGNFGTFSASGTVTRTRSHQTTFPWYTSITSRVLETYFSYGKYCVNLNEGGPPGAYHHHYVVRAIQHEGGTKGFNISQISPPLANCITYNEPGSGGEKVTTNATTWAAGVSVLGASLSSRTGFRTNAKQEYKFDTPGRLCGTHDTPNGAPRRLLMRAM